MSVFGVTLHQLGEGDVFDLNRRTPADLDEDDEDNDESEDK
jgi:hypothetical protein